MPNKARYYHLKVYNQRIWAVARNVVVNIIQIDRLGLAGEWCAKYSTGPIPLRWQYSAHHGGHSREIGREQYCDLGFIPEEGVFKLSLQFEPEWCPSTLNANDAMRVHLVAVGDNGMSNELVVELRWNGKWDDDADAMAQHLEVRVVENEQTVPTIRPLPTAHKALTCGDAK
jgi:hypothetical protein